MTAAKSKSGGTHPGAARGAGDDAGKDVGDTRERIARVFVRLVTASPLEKVSIAALVKEAGINRKTFYYHFSDKADLVAWIFRSALARRLTHDFEPSRLAYPDPAVNRDERYPELPCYLREDDGRGLTAELAGLMLDRREYYLHVLRDPEGAFARYLAGLYEPVIVRKVGWLPGGGSLSPAARSFLAGYAVDAMVVMLKRLLERPLSAGELSEVMAFVNVAYEGLIRAIRERLGD